MNNSTTTIKTTAIAEADVGTELSKTGVTVMAMSTAVIGLWGVTCLFAGTINSGDPIVLISNLITAIVG
ncbi:MAG: hypothetical protein DSY80_06555 [Desulfocapsa sp.]|nr:MAG: hypothetical protein DSY80_06555 [Desulfocapsa sp.]